MMLFINCCLSMPVYSVQRGIISYSLIVTYSLSFEIARESEMGEDAGCLRVDLPGVAVFCTQLQSLIKSSEVRGCVGAYLRPTSHFTSQMIADIMAQVWHMCLSNGVAVFCIQLQSLVESGKVGGASPSQVRYG